MLPIDSPVCEAFCVVADDESFAEDDRMECELFCEVTESAVDLSDWSAQEGFDVYSSSNSGSPSTMAVEMMFC